MTGLGAGVARRGAERATLTRGCRDVGLMVLALGAAGLPALALAAALGPASVAAGLAAMVIPALGGGALTLALTTDGEPRVGAEALIAVALGWLACAVLAAVPYHVAALLDPAPTATLAAFRRPAVALFEGMSGVTGTGLSVTEDPSVLPASLQLWRSTTQWVGGIGWMMLALMLVAPLHGLPGSEEGGPYRRHEPQLGAERTTDALAERSRDPVTAIWLIYLGLTAAAMVALRLAGMPPWEAVNHALTGISTGGFAITSDSFNSYGPAVLWTTTAIMAAGAVSFAAHAALLALGPLAPGEARQLRWLGGGLVVGSGAALLIAHDAGGNLAEVVFNWVSALATCGFIAQPLGSWPVAGLLLLSLGMFVGACSGSTGGGLKMRRLATISDGLGHRIASACESGERDEDSGDEDPTTLRRLHDAAARLCFLFFALTLGLIAILLLTPGSDAPLEDVLLDVTAALSTAGLSTGFVGPDLPSGTLVAFSLVMWLGRLEVLAVLVTLLSAARLARRAAGTPVRALHPTRRRAR